MSDKKESMEKKLVSEAKVLAKDMGALSRSGTDITIKDVPKKPEIELEKGEARPGAGLAAYNADRGRGNNKNKAVQAVSEKTSARSTASTDTGSRVSSRTPSPSSRSEKSTGSGSSTPRGTEAKGKAGVSIGSSKTVGSNIRLVHYSEAVRTAFKKFSAEEHNSENINFILAVEALKKEVERERGLGKDEKSIQAEFQSKYKELYDNYISTEAANQVNLSDKDRKPLDEQAKTGSFTIDAFRNAQSRIESMMESDILTRFVTSKIGQAAIAAAIEKGEDKVLEKEIEKTKQRYALSKEKNPNALSYLQAFATSTGVQNIEQLLQKNGSGRLFSSDGFVPLPREIMGDNAKRIIKEQIKPVMPINKENIKEVLDKFKAIDEDLTKNPEWKKYWDAQRKLLGEKVDVKEGKEMDERIRVLQINVLSSYRYKVCLEATGLQDAAAIELLQAVNVEQKKLQLEKGPNAYNPDDASPKYPDSEKVYTAVYQKSLNKFHKTMTAPGGQGSSRRRDRLASSRDSAIIGTDIAQKVVAGQFKTDLSKVVTELIDTEKKWVAEKIVKLGKRTYFKFGGLLQDDEKQVQNMQIMIGKLEALQDDIAKEIDLSNLERLTNGCRTTIQDCITAQKKAGGVTQDVGSSGPAMGAALKALDELSPAEKFDATVAKGSPGPSPEVSDDDEPPRTRDRSGRSRM